MNWLPWVLGGAGFWLWKTERARAEEFKAIGLEIAERAKRLRYRPAQDIFPQKEFWSCRPAVKKTALPEARISLLVPIAELIRQLKEQIWTWQRQIEKRLIVEISARAKESLEMSEKVEKLRYGGAFAQKEFWSCRPAVKKTALPEQL